MSTLDTDSFGDLLHSNLCETPYKLKKKGFTYDVRSNAYAFSSFEKKSVSISPKVLNMADIIWLKTFGDIKPFDQI